MRTSFISPCLVTGGRPEASVVRAYLRGGPLRDRLPAGGPPGPRSRDGGCRARPYRGSLTVPALRGDVGDALLGLVRRSHVPSPLSWVHDRSRASAPTCPGRAASSRL